jgi:hypothetical protein
LDERQITYTTAAPERWKAFGVFSLDEFLVSGKKFALTNSKREGIRITRYMCQLERMRAEFILVYSKRRYPDRRKCESILSRPSPLK